MDLHQFTRMVGEVTLTRWGAETRRGCGVGSVERTTDVHILLTFSSKYDE